MSAFRQIIAGIVMAFAATAAPASDFSEPWKNSDRALVIDAYEYNPIDWENMVADKRIVGFINKASDGLPPPYFCSGDETEQRMCKYQWRRHAVAQELFSTRRTLAKALGLKWGAYHLARPGNPVKQAHNFLTFAKPGPDDLMALDIEDNDPSKWMSLSDAEIFIAEIERRTGRFPVLYTNGNTAQHIADNRELYPLLSRLPLWYARYKPEIGLHFPKGNWSSYSLWQFSSQVNCNAKSCPYRVDGVKYDIDVNVAPMSAQALRDAWPFGDLLPVRNEDMLVADTVAVPQLKDAAVAGEAHNAYASVQLQPGSALALLNAFAKAGDRYPKRAVADPLPQPETPVFAEMTPPPAASAALDPVTAPEAFRERPVVDPIQTASIGAAFDRAAYPVVLLRPQQSGETFEQLFGDAPRTGIDYDALVMSVYLAAPR